jgi:transcription elongation factor Elf1
MPTTKWAQDNPEKMQKYRRDWYNNNKERAYKKVQDRKKLLQEWMQEYKSKLICSKCEENHPATLQFHHVDPSEKEVTVSQTISKGWSTSRIEKEISKCVVLCANCHAKHHYEERYGSEVLR